MNERKKEVCSHLIPRIVASEEMLYLECITCGKEFKKEEENE